MINTEQLKSLLRGIISRSSNSNFPIKSLIDGGFKTNSELTAVILSFALLSDNVQLIIFFLNYYRIKNMELELKASIFKQLFKTAYETREVYLLDALLQSHIKVEPLEIDFQEFALYKTIQWLNEAYDEDAGIAGFFDKLMLPELVKKLIETIHIDLTRTVLTTLRPLWVHVCLYSMDINIIDVIAQKIGHDNFCLGQSINTPYVRPQGKMLPGFPGILLDWLDYRCSNEGITRRSWQGDDEILKGLLKIIHHGKDKLISLQGGKALYTLAHWLYTDKDEILWMKALIWSGASVNMKNKENLNLREIAESSNGGRGSKLISFLETIFPREKRPWAVLIQENRSLKKRKKSEKSIMPSFGSDIFEHIYFPLDLKKYLISQHFELSQNDKNRLLITVLAFNFFTCKSEYQSAAWILIASGADIESAEQGFNGQNIKLPDMLAGSGFSFALKSNIRNDILPLPKKFNIPATEPKRYLYGLFFSFVSDGNEVGLELLLKIHCPFQGELGLFYINKLIQIAKEKKYFTIENLLNSILIALNYRKDIESIKQSFQKIKSEHRLSDGSLNKKWFELQTKLRQELLYAIDCAKIETVKELVACGADLNFGGFCSPRGYYFEFTTARNIDGIHPLHLACLQPTEESSLIMFQLLVDLGASVHSANEYTKLRYGKNLKDIYILDEDRQELYDLICNIETLQPVLKSNEEILILYRSQKNVTTSKDHKPCEMYSTQSLHHIL